MNLKIISTYNIDNETKIKKLIDFLKLFKTYHFLSFDFKY